MLDLLIKGGSVIDGTGKAAVQADVGIVGDQIAEVGRLPHAQAKRIIVATDLMVCPGFIDIHNHAHDEAEGGILEIPEADNLLRQGITTVIAGNCGGSPLPIGAHLSEVERKAIRMNYGLLVGHGSIRREVMGTVNRPSTLEEVAKMEDLARVAMDEGAFGMSTGLAYVPGSYSQTEEVIALSKIVAHRGGIFTSHIRNEGLEVMESVREVIRVAEGAEIPVEISHLKLWGKGAWGRTGELLGQIDDARERGLHVTADQYPYIACYTGLRSLVPHWALAEDGLKKRLQDPALRAEIREAMVQKMELTGGPERILIAICKDRENLEGKTLDIAADQMGLSPLEAAIELIQSNSVSAIYFAMQEEDVQTIMGHSAVMVGTDGHLRKYRVGVSHPRNYGTFPRVLGRYTREERILSLPEAVRKMTALPADTLGLQSRGGIHRGKGADIVVLDPTRVRDQATFEDGHQYPEGMEYVLVNGSVAVDQGHTTPGRYGRVLWRERQVKA